MISITKEFLFDSAHKLCREDISPEENKEIYGKCFNLHGHTFRLKVTVSGEVNKYGMVVNFSELKAIVKEKVLDHYDHQYLNDLPEFKSIPTTVENIIAKVHERLSTELTNRGLRLESITLYETPTSFATIVNGL